MKACMRISQKTQKVLKLGLSLTSTRLLLNMKVLWSSHLSFKGLFFWVENKQMTIQLPNPSGIYTKKLTRVIQVINKQPIITLFRSITMLCRTNNIL